MTDDKSDDPDDQPKPRPPAGPWDVTMQKSGRTSTLISAEALRKKPPPEQ